MRSRAAEDGDLRRQQTLPSPDMKHHSNAAADVAVAERGVSLLFFGAEDADAWKMRRLVLSSASQSFDKCL